MSSSSKRKVLFQKLAGRWFVFSVTGDDKNDVIYAILPEGMSPEETSWEMYEVIESQDIRDAQA